MLRRTHGRKRSYDWRHWPRIPWEDLGQFDLGLVYVAIMESQHGKIIMVRIFLACGSGGHVVQDQGAVSRAYDLKTSLQAPPPNIVALVINFPTHAFKGTHSKHSSLWEVKGVSLVLRAYAVKEPQKHQEELHIKSSLSQMSWRRLYCNWGSQGKLPRNCCKIFHAAVKECVDGLEPRFFFIAAGRLE